MHMTSHMTKILRKVALGTVAALTLTAGMAMQAETRSKKGEIARNLDIFNSVYKELQLNYVDTIDAEKSINTAINAMLNDIDPYTEYFPASEQEDFKVISTGEYGGMGSYIMQRADGVYISEPYEGSPAQKSGLRAGDRLLMIDSDTVTSWTSAKVSERLKGQPGTKLHLQVQRPHTTDSIIDVDIVREKIQMPSVPYYGVLGKDKNIGYIALSSFTDKAPAEVKDALLDLKANHGIKSLILDLQGNGGGLLESAVKIVGYFVPKGTEVLRTRGKGALSEKVYKTTNSPIDTRLPLIVLTDGNSASSSEIVAGSLQDMDRAMIVGNRSFGKGLVQSTRPLPYDGLLKVTIAKYYIPSGRLIQAIDYSRRNPDGSVARIPDSLTNVFHTKHGREVRDGGGITPDVTVTLPQNNRLTYNIIRDNWAFDFATRYAAKHPTVPSAADFVVTDSIFNEFKQSIDPDKFKYDRACESVLAALREAAETEGYMNDSVKAQIDVLDGMLKHNLNHDLDQNRPVIEALLAGEIMKRYYYQRGAAQNLLRYDAAVDSAVNILSDPAVMTREPFSYWQ